MPANKKASKSGRASTPKKKAAAPARAANRQQRQRREPAARTPRSAAEISISRYPGETPLTGEDRPADRPTQKRRGHTGRPRTPRD
jgi:hypothetical protein